MKEMLGPGGRLFLSDVVFSFPLAEHRREIDGWIARMAKPAGEGFSAADFATHVRDSSRPAFRIERKNRWDVVYADYVCAKIDARSAG